MNIVNQDFGYLVDQLCTINHPDVLENQDTMFADLDFSFMSTDAVNFKDDLLVDKFKDIIIGDENVNEWSLNFTQKNGYNYYSNGYCYVVDRPKRDLVDKAS
ncbi:unnamed protein product [Brachionus calyciflorus]|uniref:Uncharacterized protein n=1 Tax=Brachionus calyciflorus TaxID=104777 RepID=A0A814RP22_9BILA|nr:unnamed protein product [Brachionus calyciflorus]